MGFSIVSHVELESRHAHCVLVAFPELLTEADSGVAPEVQICCGRILQISPQISSPT